MLVFLCVVLHASQVHGYTQHHPQQLRSGSNSSSNTSQAAVKWRQQPACAALSSNGTVVPQAVADNWGSGNSACPARCKGHLHCAAAFGACAALHCPQLQHALQLPAAAAIHLQGASNNKRDPEQHSSREHISQPPCVLQQLRKQGTRIFRACSPQRARVQRLHAKLGQHQQPKQTCNSAVRVPTVAPATPPELLTTNVGCDAARSISLSGARSVHSAVVVLCCSRSSSSGACGIA